MKQSQEGLMLRASDQTAENHSPGWKETGELLARATHEYLLFYDGPLVSILHDGADTWAWFSDPEWGTQDGWEQHDSFYKLPTPGAAEQLRALMEQDVPQGQEAAWGARMARVCAPHKGGWSLHSRGHLLKEPSATGRLYRRELLPATLLAPGELGPREW